MGNRHDQIRVEAIEDIRNPSGSKIIARKGQQGTVDEWLIYTYGIGSESREYTSFRTKLDGRKNFQDLPNYKLKKVEEQGAA